MPPFTNGEVLHALSLVMPAQIVEGARMHQEGGVNDPCTFWVSDGMLLVLAAISEVGAQRVVGYRPDLASKVAEIRQDPNGYINSARMSAPGEGR
ncbi:MAG TPA: hypothetical protein VHG91_12430 [Longimicrobium sp.]|nr:hypothetical protein [Longimicrobium sp.]